MTSLKTIVLVTGANQGIGFEIAKMLTTSSEKYHVFVGSRSVERGTAAVSTLEASGLKGSLSATWLDVTNDTSIQHAVEDVEGKFGRLDVLINNAGIVSTAPSLAEQYRETLATNTTGPIAVTEAFLPLLRKSSNGRLIFVSSGLGSIANAVKSPSLQAAAYRSSKAALNMSMVVYHGRLQEDKIKVWGMCPGWLATNLAGNAEELAARGAGKAEEGAKVAVSIVEGERDEDTGKVVHKNGVYPW